MIFGFKTFSGGGSTKRKCKSSALIKTVESDFNNLASTALYLNFRMVAGTSLTMTVHLGTATNYLPLGSVYSLKLQK